MKHSIISAISVVLLSSLVTAQAQDKEGNDLAPTPATPETAESPPAPPLSETPSPPAPPSAPRVANPEPGAIGKGKPEVISVTGSRIRRKDLDVASPLTIVGREEIANSGAETVTEVIKQLPSAVGNSVTTTTTNGGSGGSGNIALRGLDPSSTLVLLNGRRLPKDAGGQTADMNSIPVAAIERIEVLQDGASAIYGSDAIAGVINIITRKNIDGLDVNLYFGRASRGDLETKNYDLVYGTGNEKGNMVFGLNYYTQGNIASRDRDVSKNILGPSAATPNSHVTIAGVTPKAGVIVDPAFVGTTPASGNYIPYSPASAYNYSEITDAVMSQDRKSVFLSGDYAVTSSIKAFFESTFTNTFSKYNMAPTPLFTNRETGGIVVAADNPYNTFGQVLTDVKKRFLELGPREIDTKSDTLRFVGGLQGEIGKWGWDVSANHGEVNVSSTTQNLVNKSNLIVGLGGPGACGALATLGCVPVNVLGPYGSIDGPQASWLRLSATGLTDTTMNSYTFNTNGELAKLDFATINMAAGVEIRDETYQNNTDANSQKYNTVGSANQKSTDGDRTLREAYVEFSIPTGKVVEFDLAARYSDYSDFGSTTNPKIGLKINPIDGLTLRGTYSTGFRAPSLPELYQGTQENFAQLHDPCQEAGACPVQSDENIIQFLALEGGNRNLKAEKSKSYTYGLAYTYGNAFNAKADYFVINTENAIDTSPQFIIDQFRANGTFADKITLDTQNNITIIEANALNLAKRSVKGLDLGADYTLRNTGSGTYALNVIASHYINYQNQADATSAPVNVVGTYVDEASGGRGSIPSWKGLAAFDWNLASVNAGIQLNYVSGLHADGADISNLDAWRTYDLHVGYDFARAGKVTLGVDNVTDKEPPVTDAAANDNIDARTHNLIGRFYYARYGFQI